MYVKDINTELEQLEFMEISTDPFNKFNPFDNQVVDEPLDDEDTN